jgi:hypothetical protein
MDVGVMNASQPAPLMAINEDDELFLTLTNVGMIMRPDLLRAAHDPLPRLSATHRPSTTACRTLLSPSISAAASATTIIAPDAGTYFWHCHVARGRALADGHGRSVVCPSASEQGGLRAIRCVRRCCSGESGTVNTTRTVTRDWPSFEPLRKRCGTDVLGAGPAEQWSRFARRTGGYAYNDGDGFDYYDVEIPDPDDGL